MIPARTLDENANENTDADFGPGDVHRSDYLPDLESPVIIKLLSSLRKVPDTVSAVLRHSATLFHPGRGTM